MTNRVVLVLCFQLIACGDDAAFPDTEVPDAARPDAVTADAATGDAGQDAAADSATPRDAPDLLDAGLDAPSAPDAPLDAPVDVLLDVMPDAGPALCDIPATTGPTPGDLRVEACSIVGEPIRGELFNGRTLHSIAVDDQGAVVVTVRGQPPRRFVDDDAPGCRLTPDASFPIREDGWGAAEYASDGTLYLMNFSTGGNKRLRFVGARDGMCNSRPGLGASTFTGVHTDGIVVARNSFGPAILMDTNTCVYTEATFGPGRVRSATRVDGDYVLIAGDDCALHRYGPTGTPIFIDGACPRNGNDMTRCGDDLCVIEGGGFAIQRFDGQTGAAGATYLTEEMFGPEADGNADRIGSSPDGRTVVVGVEAVHPDLACQDQSNVLLYRLTGF